MTLVCKTCGGPWDNTSTSCAICGGQEATTEERAFLAGKLQWLSYLEGWLDTHHGTVAEAWAAFQTEHPNIASGPGFVRHTAHETAHDQPETRP